MANFINVIKNLCAGKRIIGSWKLSFAYMYSSKFEWCRRIAVEQEWLLSEEDLLLFEEEPLVLIEFEEDNEFDFLSTCDNYGDCNGCCDACEAYSPDKYHACCDPDICTTCTKTQLQHQECCGGTVSYINALNKLVCDTCAWELENAL